MLPLTSPFFIPINCPEKSMRPFVHRTKQTVTPSW
nr:MAG TPA: hypothetical protein [Caudoviricetes sp.]